MSSVDKKIHCWKKYNVEYHLYSDHNITVSIIVHYWYTCINVIAGLKGTKIKDAKLMTTYGSAEGMSDKGLWWDSTTFLNI